MSSFFVLLVCVVLTNANSDNDTEKTLHNLQKEKSELILRIQEALDDSAKALQKTNDSDSKAGLQHLEELKEYFNQTNGEDEADFKNGSRRSGRPKYIQKGKVKLDLFDIASLFGKKESVSKMVREKNQVLMREKLREWIKEKEQERKTIKAYKEKLNLISEKCPRNGLGSAVKSKKKNNRRVLTYKLSPSEEKKKKLKEEKKERKLQKKLEKRLARRKKYPCCRKCCKRSYLGCL